MRTSFPVVLGICCTAPVLALEHRFIDYPGAEVTRVRDLSRDGSVAVGTALLGGQELGFVWTVAGGFTILPGDPDGGRLIPTHVSADGHIVAGRREMPESWDPSRWRIADGFRWSASEGLEQIAFGDTRSIPSAISSDGNVIVGTVERSGGFSYRWSRGTGLEPIPFDPPDYAVVIWGISGDGGVIVGATEAPDRGRPLAWRDGQPIAAFDAALPPGAGYASFVSEDGTTIIGAMEIGTDQLIFRWSEATGFEHTPDLSPNDDGLGANFLDATADGRMVFYRSLLDGAGADRFVWTPDGQVVTLEAFLEAATGEDIPRWTNFSAVSGDGRWVAVPWELDGRTATRLIAIPAPGVGLGLAGLAAFACRRRR